MVENMIMEYTFEKLNKDNCSKYYDYLSFATTLESELMSSSDIDKRIAKKLFDEMTKDCVKHNIDGIRLSSKTEIILNRKRPRSMKIKRDYYLD